MTLRENVLADLAAPLDPKRVTVGTKFPLDGVPYLDGEDVIRTANAIFGPGAWGFRVVGQPWIVEAGVQGDRQTPYQVWACIGELAVDGAVVRSDIGTNVRHGDGSGGLEMALKGSATDALKRCLVHFGDQFGLILRDKEIGRGDLNAAWERYQIEHGHPPAGEGHHPSEPAAAPARDSDSAASNDDEKSESPPTAASPQLPPQVLEVGKALRGMGLNFNADPVRSILREDPDERMPKLTAENIAEYYLRWENGGDGRNWQLFVQHVMRIVEADRKRAAS